MKIAVVSHLYNPFFLGGAEVSSELLARGLHEAGHESFVITAAVGGGPCVEEVDGVPVHRLKTGLPYDLMHQGGKSKWQKTLWHAKDLWNPAVYRAVKLLLRKERPDVLHTNVIMGLSPSVWSAARALEIPVVHTLRDYYLLCVRTCMFTKSGQLCDRLCSVCKPLSVWHRFSARNVNAVVGISKSILDRHREFGLFRDVASYIVHNAVPLEAGQDRTPALKKTGEPLVMVFMGTMEPYKGLEVMLKAVTSSPHLALRLHVCGRGLEASAADSLRLRFGNDPRIIFEGVVRRERRDAILAGADVVLVPSIWHEPFGRTVIEGYQHGLAVVASRIGGMPELVEDGVTGRLFEPGNAKDLAAVLAELASAPDRLKMMQKAAAVRAQDFSLGIHIEKYLRVYRDVCG